MPLYLVYGSGEYAAAHAAGFPLCRLGYRIAEEGDAFLEPEDAAAETPELILLSDDAVPAAGSALAKTAARYCAEKGCGMIADFSASPSDEKVSFLQELDAAFLEAGMELTVPESYGDTAPQSRIMISSAICGGSFASRVQEAVQRYPGRSVLELEPVCTDFALPCLSGSGEPLSHTALEDLQRQYQPYIHDSPDLLCRYFFYEEKESLHIVMFDTEQTLRKKRETAEQAGFQWAVGLYQELFPARE